MRSITKSNEENNKSNLDIPFMIQLLAQQDEVKAYLTEANIKELIIVVNDLSSKMGPLVNDPGGFTDVSNNSVGHRPFGRFPLQEPYMRVSRSYGSCDSKFKDTTFEPVEQE